MVYYRAQSLNLSLGELVLPDVKIFRRTAKILRAQLKILGAQLKMLGASISIEKVKSLTVSRLFVIFSLLLLLQSCD